MATMQREKPATSTVSTVTVAASPGSKRVIGSIYWSYGIDDVGACIDFLVECKVFKSAKDDDEGPGADIKITAPEFQFEGKRSTFIKQIEGKKQQMDLKRAVVDAWGAIEDAMAGTRGTRYGDAT